MKRVDAIVVLIVLALVIAVPAIAVDQTGGKPSATTAKKTAAPKMTDAQKIALAMSAGPAEIAKNATIIDMTDMPGGQMKQLREGTNGWVCYAHIGAPMCLDKEWQKWAEAWMSKGQPKIEGTGIGYMLRGDQGASNVDAYATDPKSGGPWVMWKGTPYAHVMVPVSPTKAATMPSK